MRWWILALILLFPSVSRATVGGPETIEIVGFDAVDAKVYFILDGVGDGGSPADLAFLSLRSTEPGRVRIARSWRALRTSRAGDVTFEARLERLRARLIPMKSTVFEGATLTQSFRSLVICGDGPSRLEPAVARAVIDAYIEGESSPDTPVCQTLDVRIDAGGWAGTKRVESWGGVELTALYTLPEVPVRLGMIRYVGRHYESGYEVDAFVLMRPTSRR